MSEVTVTKLQMDAIEGCKDNKESLNETLSFARGKVFGGSCVCINNMTTEQIVLAWHGYAKVEPNFVDFEEAMRALSKRGTIYYHYTVPLLFEEGDLEKTLKINFDMKPSYFDSVTTWGDLVKGKFTTEGGTQ